MKNRAVFLDRDGVLNATVNVAGVDCPPPDARALVLFPSAEEAVQRLRQAGFLCICVTNQPDIARGKRSTKNVMTMNERVFMELGLDDLFMCPHDTPDNCNCRKPKPGMLIAAADKWNLDLSECWMVGDRKTDIAAGHAVGCRTIFINNSHAGIAFEPNPDFICTDVGEASLYIIAGDGGGIQQQTLSNSYLFRTRS